MELNPDIEVVLVEMMQPDIAIFTATWKTAEQIDKEKSKIYEIFRSPFAVGI